MKKILLGLFCLNLIFGTQSFAQDISIKYASGIRHEDKQVLENVMEEVASMLPEKMKAMLPKDIEIKIENLSNHKVIPDEVCSSSTGTAVDKNATKKEKNSRPFIYGHYKKNNNALTINSPVLLELKKGKANSKRINCQHKSLYDQAIATIIHELTHAYDFNNGRVSNSIEFITRAGFKKGLLKVKNKNIQAMRSADVYELVNIAESFAVNMEYFTMDPEFLCRKPSMFNYFKNKFGEDPFPNRTCKINNIVMVSTQTGYVPTALDSSRVYRIDYLLASAGKGISSGFGHSMFRIIMCAPERFDPITNRTIPATPFGKKCLEDKLFHMVVSYRANVEDGKLDYLKGLFGGYPSMLFLLPFSDVLDEYNRDELRDIISYPLTLSSKEREEFIMRVKEEHWNYRGSYKFITSNCATESYDLLKSALERSQLNTKKSVTPNGVLEDLDKLQFLSMSGAEIETYKAKTDQVILAYNMAYGYKLKNESANKKAVQKFIDESTIEGRMARFQKFAREKIQQADLNAEVTLLKERLVAASSFSVMEQQILRTKALLYRKQAADMLMNAKDERIKEMVRETGTAFAQPFSELFNKGYGIPFMEEIVSLEVLAGKAADSAAALAKAEAMLREIMPEQFVTLEKMSSNVKVYNSYSLTVRKEFRAKLELYINQVLKNLAREDFTREIMLSAAQGDAASILKIRELLGKDLVTEREILDVKLKRLIQEML